MIKVEKIKGGELAKLEDEFYNRITHRAKGRRTPLEKLKLELKHKRKVKRAILEYCIANYRKIIVGSPTKLQGIVNHFNKMQWTLYIKNNKAFKNKLLKLFGYESNFLSIETKGVWYSKILNIKACPYCNSQFILITRKNKNEYTKKFQFDHFFPQASAPYLCTSMYNLIPCCGYCNHVKSQANFKLSNSYHPYHNSLHEKAEFALESKSVLLKLLLSDVAGTPIKIEFKSRKKQDEAFVKRHDRIFEINGIYENHTDFAEELVMKAIWYPKSRKREILKLKGLFADEATYNRYLLGNYPTEEDILKRPLAKFTQDIARQFKLIE